MSDFIPNGKLVQISERLKFSISDIHLLFGKKHNDELNKISSIYRLIRTNNYRKAYKEAQLLRVVILTGTKTSVLLTSVKSGIEIVASWAIELLKLKNSTISKSNFFILH